MAPKTPTEPVSPGKVQVEQIQVLSPKPSAGLHPQQSLLLSEVPQELEKLFDATPSEKISQNSSQLPTISQLDQARSGPQAKPLQVLPKNHLQATPMKLWQQWFGIVREAKPGVLKGGIPHLEEALKTCPEEVRDLFKLKDEILLLKALCQHPWVKQTLADAGYKTECVNSLSPDPNDFKPEVFGHEGHCNETSMLCNLLLAQLIGKFGDKAQIGMINRLEPGGNGKHTWVAFTDSQNKQWVIDPTWRQYQMLDKEISLSFEKYSPETQSHIQKLKMIYFGPDSDHQEHRSHLPNDFFSHQ